MAGVKAFREAFMSGGVLDEADFSDFEARKVRYDIYWALFENTAYRTLLHPWSQSYKLKLSLYKHIREIYSPAYRLCEFHRAHLMGGLLDPEAGDGVIEPSALPIVIPSTNEVNDVALRAAISNVWEWSNFQATKDVYTLYGTVFGDTALKIVDSVEHDKVYVEVVHPGLIRSVDLDPFGNVKGYEFEEVREHPTVPGKAATYLEVAERDGIDVVYSTYLNGELFAWDGDESEWSVPYGFVPLVVNQHDDVGLEWGWSELHPGRLRFHELDDIASSLSDQIRKTVNTVWFFSGQAAPKTVPVLSGADSTTARPDPQREELNALYTANERAKATALVAPLDLSGTVAYLNSLVERLEEDYPELRFEKFRISNVSGETLREARKPVEEKVTQRRASYDNALRRAHQMAVAIGGFRGMFPGFNLDSYRTGALDHWIGKRPVFTEDITGELENEKLFWLTAIEAGKAGVTLPAFLRLQGWTEERILEITEDEEYSRKLEISEAALSGLGNLGVEVGDRTNDDSE